MFVSKEVFNIHLTQTKAVAYLIPAVAYYPRIAPDAHAMEPTFPT